jgi:hypothetical protein
MATAGQRRRSIRGQAGVRVDQDGERAGRDFLRGALGQSAGRVLVAVEMDDDIVIARARGTWMIAPFGEMLTAPVQATARITRERFRSGGI